jgi:hypothetical protein
MLERTHRTDFDHIDLVKFLTVRLKMKIKDSRIWVVIVITVIALSLFWAGALVYAYVVDDVSPTPADEMSMPAPKPL